MNSRMNDRQPSPPSGRRRPWWEQTGGGHRRRRRRSTPSKYFVALLALATSSPRSPFSSAYVADDDEPRSTKVIGNYGPHRYNARNGLSNPANVDYTKLTRINYGPFRINENGAIWGSDVNADPQLLYGPRDWNPPSGSTVYCHIGSAEMSTINSCGTHHYEEGLLYQANSVYVTIGGREYADEFRIIAASTEGRVKFAENAALVVTTYGFDGINLDYQHPQSPEEMFNYSLLLSDLQLALYRVSHQAGGVKTYGLTANVPCDDEGMEHIDIDLMEHVLTEFNLMTYDFHTPLDGEVGVNSPLYDQSGGKYGYSVNSCVMRYLNGGASRSKLNVGVPFYGQSYRGATYVGDECQKNWAGDCSDLELWQASGGTPEYHSIYERMDSMQLHFDLETMTPLASHSRGVVSFDDPRSVCTKVEYGQANELNGFVVNDLTGDLLDDKSTPLLDALNLKLRMPDMDCGGEEFKTLFEWRAVAPYDPNAAVATVSGSAKEDSWEAVAISKPEATYRYTCGVGEADAKDRCSRFELVEISCEYSSCPGGMLCFVVPCTKPLIDEESEPQAVQHQKSIPAAAPSAVSFTNGKPKPKRKPRKKPPVSIPSQSLIAEKKDARPVPNRGNENPPQIEHHSSPGEKAMAFSCGTNLAHAQKCSTTPCLNGLSDCPKSQFCFRVECNEQSASVSPVSQEASVAKPAGPVATETSYHCGETRAEALTCSEECGFAWQCPDGKDCYMIECPIT